ncbi:zinc transporter ZIP2 isoform X2 [Vulpes vulpes]|uniref:Zinc transporter ZIP2 isoform X2 n=2 Tax=Canidae TaxID=9608 RepID=A0A3Q7RQL7_VULVU
MEPLLGAKIGCLLALLLLTLGCGLIPICFKWFHTDAATGRHRRALSLLGCASAGVFLGAGLMHMTAEALEGIESEIQGLMMQDGKGGQRLRGFRLCSDGVPLRRAPHLPGLLLGLPLGVAGVAVLSWGHWRNHGAGGGVGWHSCPGTAQPRTATLSLKGAPWVPHPLALTVLSLGVRGPGRGAAADGSGHGAALSGCPGSQGARGVWRGPAAGAERRWSPLGRVVHTVAGSHVPRGPCPGAGCH